MKDTIKPSSFYDAPVSQKLVQLIERNADELTRSYLEEVKESRSLPTYRSFDESEIYKRAHKVYSQLGMWISQETTKDEVKKYWEALGRQRKQEGFSFHEIVLSLSILRRHLWLKVQSEGLLDTALDFYQAMELYSCVVTFFDRAVYYASCGYEGKD